jgi:hypothetical protein
MAVVDLGFWKHDKTGDIYEVIANALSADNITGEYSDEEMVVYRNVKTRQVFTRHTSEYIKKFTFQENLADPVKLFYETYRQNRLFYLEQARTNPMFLTHGGHLTHKYVIGDKVAFARSIRLISTEEANRIITEINGWSGEPVTFDERQHFDVEPVVKYEIDAYPNGDIDIMLIHNEARAGFRAKPFFDTQVEDRFALFFLPAGVTIKTTLQSLGKDVSPHFDVDLKRVCCAFNEARYTPEGVVFKY